MSDPAGQSNSKLLKKDGYFKKNIIRALNFASASLPVPESINDVATRTVVGLIKTFMLADDGMLQDDEIKAFREVLSQYYSEEKVNILAEILQDCDPVSPEAAAKILRKGPRKKALSVVKMLDELSFDENEAQKELFCRLCALLDIRPDELKSLKAEADKNTRRRLLKSGAGVIVAISIIVLFIATATVLRSVVFGLILAYICLPLEKFFERLLKGRYNPVCWCFALTDWIFSPLKRLAAKLAGRRTGDDQWSESEIQKRITVRASGLTVFCVIIFIITVFTVVSRYSIEYVNNLSERISSAQKTDAAEPDGAEKETVTAAAGEENSNSPNWESAVDTAENPAGGEQKISDLVITRLENKVNDLKERFESIPAVNWALGQLSTYIAEGNAAGALKNFLSSQSSGIFSFTAGFLSNIGSFLVDILLTIFFFSLFIIKIAAMTGRKNGSMDENYSHYIVSTVFNGKWLPSANETALRDGEAIIEEVIYKLKVWLKGYLVLMSIDFTVYTTVFYLLDVPYFPIFGLLACCGVLLPYIGPIVAAVLTVLVTLAIGGDSVTGMQLLGITGIYLWQNGIVDQFFLYPWIIGDSLGLTAMETIVVVLLGGIFAGITGMIFALPAAAVMKYLIPQIYKIWK